MTDIENLIIVPFDSSFDRTGFHSGVESLDVYLRKQARQDIKRHISRVFLALKKSNPEKVIGYYTLSALSIELNKLPEKLVRKLPKHPIPAALIGRLAVSKDEQGVGIGKMLLADAIKRSLAVSDQIAIYAMVVDVINDNVRGFYEQFGFTPLSDDSQRLFLPLKSFES